MSDEASSRVLDANKWVGEKLAWHLAVMLEPSLTPTAKILASLLLHDLNVRTGDAWRAQTGDDGLAARAGRTIRSVQLALKELAEAGFLRITKQGRSNRYVACLKQENPGSPSDGDEIANWTSPNVEQTGEQQFANHQAIGEESAANRRTQLRPNPLENPARPPSAPSETLPSSMAIRDERTAFASAAEFFAELAADPQFGPEGASSVLYEAEHSPPGLLTVRSQWAMTRLTRDARHLVQRWGVTVQVRQ